MPQPTKKTLTAETSAQKNFSCPRPKGCRWSGAPFPRTSPTLSNTWLPTSASEWTVSAKSVGDPVTNQPNPFAAAIALLVAIEIETEEDIGRVRPLGTNLPRAQDHPFLASEAFEPDRPARMQLVGGNADLRAEAVLEAVGKARRRVDHHRARIDFASEAHRIGMVRRDDRVRVLRAAP